MIKTLIFDFDGTLIDTNQVIINSFKHIYKVFHNKEADVDYVLSTFGEPLVLTLSRDFGQYNYDDVIKTYREYQKQRFNDEVTLYDTVTETLDYLYEKNIKMGIATSRLRTSTYDALKNFKIEKYFSSVVSADDVEKHKPDKEPAVKVLNSLNTKSSEALFVGDSKFDIECALNAQITPVLVGWHKESRELAKAYNVKYLLNQMWDLTKII